MAWRGRRNGPRIGRCWGWWGRRQLIEGATDLLYDQTAVRFLISWSIFESDCCGGFLKFDDIPNAANKAICSDPNLPKVLDETLLNFHHRYQDDKRRNLNSWYHFRLAFDFMQYYLFSIHI
jgi:hypothetical protein